MKFMTINLFPLLVLATTMLIPTSEGRLGAVVVDDNNMNEEPAMVDVDNTMVNVLSNNNPNDDEKQQQDRKLILCPQGNTWGDGTHVLGISEYCCRACSEAPFICATHWPSDSIYRCGVDPYQGWPDGTDIIPATGWRCANGWSYWSSTATYKCGKDTHCWPDGTRTTPEFETGCCNVGFILNNIGGGGSSSPSTNRDSRCGAFCIFAEARGLTDAACSADFDRDNQTPALYCSNGRTTNCQT